jgi:hypothetical protein
MPACPFDLQPRPPGQCASEPEASLPGQCVPALASEPEASLPAHGVPAVHAQAAPAANRPATRKRARSLLTRSTNFANDQCVIEIRLSEPDDGEECSVTMQPIADATLDFLPADAPRAPIVARPELTKGTLACGHGFSALALLYHFAKNCMRCPNCREGSAARMAGQSVPAHLRKAFRSHLEREAEADRREQVASDMHAAAEILESEVNSAQARAYMNRVVVTVYVFDSMHAVAPVSVQTLPLGMTQDGAGRGSGPSSDSEEPPGPAPGTASSATGPTLRFESFGYSCRELSRNLRAMGVDSQAFELVVGAHDVYDGIVMLYRTDRFGADAGERRVAGFGHEGEDVSVRVWCPGGIQRVRWTVGRAALCRMLTAGEPDPWL